MSVVCASSSGRDNPSGGHKRVIVTGKEVDKMLVCGMLNLILFDSGSYPESCYTIKLGSFFFNGDLTHGQ